MSTVSQFCAYSLVRDADGRLLDPSLCTSEPPLSFVPHPRYVGGFFSRLNAPEPPHVLVVYGVQEPEDT
ncbi:hypothetical protein C0Z18_13040 [Trinickia dabaoshanensis]|uniref:Uncharacterized protein n=1 Tax=Trinickia dabaoshanensis TaxID=564714 RepID=A0A2N7VRH5_9BURK|nr:hypothetical protein C0Z18_13040 [Trinickia dabaoshanensis]